MVHLGSVVECWGNEDDRDGVICARFFETTDESREKGMNDLFAVAFAICCKFPELGTDLDEDGDSNEKKTAC